jgi:hypothetical protein
MVDFRHDVELRGFSVVPDLLDSDEINRLFAALSPWRRTTPFAKEGAFMRFEICLMSFRQSLDWPDQPSSPGSSTRL